MKDYQNYFIELWTHPKPSRKLQESIVVYVNKNGL